MTIHSEHPFADPPGERSPVRQLRGRFAASVTLWTAGTGSDRAGLPVASTLVADGEPARLLGLIDEEADVYSTLMRTGRFVVTLLQPGQQRIADEFAGVLPVPGGAFRHHDWTQTDWGPVAADAITWAGCRFDAARPYGWAMVVEATIEQVQLGESEPLLYHRGRYRTLS